MDPHCGFDLGESKYGTFFTLILYDNKSLMTMLET